MNTGNVRPIGERFARVLCLTIKFQPRYWFHGQTQAEAIQQPGIVIVIVNRRIEIAVVFPDFSAHALFDVENQFAVQKCQQSRLLFVVCFFLNQPNEVSGAAGFGNS